MRIRGKKGRFIRTIFDIKRCLDCNKEIYQYSKRCRECSNKLKLGKPTWNKGKIINYNKKGPLRTIIRESIKYRLWRSAIFQRDNYTCCDCGSVGKILHAHHIKPFALIIKENNIDNYDSAIKCEELWAMNNGVTLCIECHKKTDTYLKGNIKD